MKRLLVASVVLLVGWMAPPTAIAQYRDHEFVIPIELHDLHPDVRAAIVICEVMVWSRPADVPLRQERSIPVYGSYSGTVTITRRAPHPKQYRCWLELQHKDGRRSAPLAPSRTSTRTTSLIDDPIASSRLDPVDELAWARIESGTPFHTEERGDLPLECVN